MHSQKLEDNLKMLFEQTSGNAQLPEGLALQNIIQNMVFPGDSIETGVPEGSN
jgi:hypothetical protein